MDDIGKNVLFGSSQGFRRLRLCSKPRQPGGTGLGRLGKEIIAGVRDRSHTQPMPIYRSSLVCGEVCGVVSLLKVWLVVIRAVDPVTQGLGSDDRCRGVCSIGGDGYAISTVSQG